MKAARYLIASAVIAVWGCGQSETPPPQEQTEQPMQQEEPQMAESGGIPQVMGDTVTTPSGLKYIEITEGTGAMPETGQLVVAHYTGWLPDGSKFDSSRDRGAPFSFPIGQGRVIKGWDEGLGTMKVGGRRLLIIPYNLAYGEAGRPPQIPARSTLIFDVELMEVRSTG